MARSVRNDKVFCGIDVGKSGHHACTLDLDGGRLHDKALTNDEAELRAVFTKLQTHGRVLVVIDQPASIGALAVAAARSVGLATQSPRLPTGADDAPTGRPAPGSGQDRRPRRLRRRLLIGGAVLSHPRTLRRVGTDDETLADLTVLAGYDDDLNQQSTRLTNRLRMHSCTFTRRWNGC